jgi:hypothetical protein
MIGLYIHVAKGSITYLGIQPVELNQQGQHFPRLVERDGGVRHSLELLYVIVYVASFENDKLLARRRHGTCMGLSYSKAGETDKEQYKKH